MSVSDPQDPYLDMPPQDPYLIMPPQSLILLASHRPVFERVMKHLPRQTRKFLRMTCSQMKEIIPLFDASFNLWKIDFGQADEFPRYFFKAVTPVKLIFPRVREVVDQEAFKNFLPGVRMIEIPWDYKTMVEITEDIKHRVVALEIDLGILSRYKNELQFENLHSLEIVGCKSDKSWLLREQQQGNFQHVISLITNNCSVLTSLKLMHFQIPEQAQVNVNLPQMQELSLVNCCGGFQFALSVVQKSVKRVVHNLVQHQISTIKKLRVETEAFYRKQVDPELICSLLTSVPNVEELHVKYLLLPRDDNLAVSLPRLRILTADNCRGIIPAVTQGARELQEIAGEQEEVACLLLEVHNNLRKISISESSVGRVSVSSSTTGLLTACAGTIQQLCLSGLIIAEDFPNLQPFVALVKLTLAGISGNICSLLKVCPNLQDLTLSYFFEELEDELSLPSVKKLSLWGCCGEVGSLFKMFPCIEELYMESTTFLFREENFSLSCLTKLSLKLLGFTEKQKNILEAKIPSHIKLEDCMENCNIIDAPY